MRCTKLYWKHFKFILATIGTVLGVVSLISSPLYESNLVEYYCASGSLFLGRDLSKFFYCGWIVYLVHFIGFMLFLLLLALLIDCIVLLFKFIKRKYRQYKSGREAKIIVVAAKVENECIVAICNDELFFRADDVSVRSRFIFFDRLYDGNIKLPNNAKNSIGPKKKILIHYASISDKKFIIHINDDEVFPIPDQEPYIFRLTISGSMSILGLKIKRVKFHTEELVAITKEEMFEIRTLKISAI